MPIYRFLLVPTLLFALTLCAMPELCAQQYDGKPFDASAKSDRFKAQRYAKTKTGEVAAYQNYIKYHLYKMTDPSPEGLAELADLRYSLFRDFVRPAEASVQKQLTNVLLSEMQKVAGNQGGNYHPSVRYNAILIIGMLDEVYADDRSQTPAKPLPAANELLTKIAADAVGDGALPPPLVVAGLVGLERHAGSLSELPQANQKATVEALKNIVVAKELSLDVTKSVEQWVKIMAARALVATKSLGTNNDIHQALVKLIGNPDYKLSNRAQVAGMLGSLSEAYTSAQGLDEKAISKVLMQLASDIAADEKQRAQKKQDDVVNRRGNFNRFSRIDADIPDEYQVRRIVMRLRGLNSALTSVMPAIKDANQKKVLEDIQKVVNPVRLEAEDTKQLVILELTRNVKTMANQIDAITSAVGIEAAEPTDIEEEEAEEAAELEAVGQGGE